MKKITTSKAKNGMRKQNSLQYIWAQSPDNWFYTKNENSSMLILHKVGRCRCIIAISKLCPLIYCNLEGEISEKCDNSWTMGAIWRKANFTHCSWWRQFLPYICGNICGLLPIAEIGTDQHFLRNTSNQKLNSSSNENKSANVSSSDLQMYTDRNEEVTCCNPHGHCLIMWILPVFVYIQCYSDRQSCPSPNLDANPY